MAATSESDRDVGLGVLFGFLGILGALGMYVGAVVHNQLVAAWGFAFAMTAGALVVTVLHVYR